MNSIKMLILTLTSLLCSMHVNAQKIHLSDILNSAYLKRPDLPIVNGQTLSYIVPEYISFVDTTRCTMKSYPFVIAYYNRKSFEDKLRKAHTATVISVYYDELSDSSLKITLEISKTKDDQYFGAFKFFTFVDKRQIKLKYNRSKSLWEFAYLLKVYDEPKAGQN